MRVSVRRPALPRVRPFGRLASSPPSRRTRFARPSFVVSSQPPRRSGTPHRILGLWPAKPRDTYPVTRRVRMDRGVSVEGQSARLTRGWEHAGAGLRRVARSVRNGQQLGPCVRRRECGLAKGKSGVPTGKSPRGAPKGRSSRGVETAAQGATKGVARKPRRGEMSSTFCNGQAVAFLFAMSPQALRWAGRWALRRARVRAPREAEVWPCGGLDLSLNGRLGAWPIGRLGAPSLFAGLEAYRKAGSVAFRGGIREVVLLFGLRCEQGHGARGALARGEFGLAVGRTAALRWAEVLPCEGQAFGLSSQDELHGPLARAGMLRRSDTPAGLMHLTPRKPSNPYPSHGLPAVLRPLEGPRDSGAREAQCGGAWVFAGVLGKGRGRPL
ncbi:hypothetical protein D3C71_24320 [compost metagenome]